MDLSFGLTLIGTQCISWGPDPTKRALWRETYTRQPFHDVASAVVYNRTQLIACSSGVSRFMQQRCGLLPNDFGHLLRLNVAVINEEITINSYAQNDQA